MLSEEQLGAMAAWAALASKKCGTRPSDFVIQMLNAIVAPQELLCQSPANGLKSHRLPKVHSRKPGEMHFLNMLVWLKPCSRQEPHGGQSDLNSKNQPWSWLCALFSPSREFMPAKNLAWFTAMFSLTSGVLSPRKDRSVTWAQKCRHPGVSPWLGERPLRGGHRVQSSRKYPAAERFPLTLHCF